MHLVDFKLVFFLNIQYSVVEFKSSFVLVGILGTCVVMTPQWYDVPPQLNWESLRRLWS